MHKIFGFQRGPAPLFRAVASGDISAVRLEVQKGINLDQTDEDSRRTALHLAAEHGYDVIVGELLDRRAKSCLKDKAGQLPLHLAAAGGHTRCCQLLLSTRNHDSDKAMSVHIRNMEGRTPLMLAAAAGHAGVVEVLVRAGADMRDALEGRVSVGHLAAAGGHVKVLAVLAALGFSLSTDTLNRNTLLHEAAKQGHTNAVAWLLQSGQVDPSIRNFDRWTALDLAKDTGHYAVVSLLKEAEDRSSKAAAKEAGGGGDGGEVAVAGSGVLSLNNSRDSSGSFGALEQQHQQRQQGLPGDPVHLHGVFVGSSYRSSASTGSAQDVGLHSVDVVYPADEAYKFYPRVAPR